MNDLEEIIEKLPKMNYGRLNRLSAAVNAEIDKRNREAEHFAHLSRTSDDPRCGICRVAAATRRD